MITFKGRNLREINTAFTFSRNSNAIQPLDGKVIEPNQPRYDIGKYGFGIRVEEGTTNIVGALDYYAYASATDNGWVSMLDNNNINRNMRSCSVAATASPARMAKNGDAVAGNTYTGTYLIKINGSGTPYISSAKPYPEGANTISVTENATTTNLGNGWWKVQLISTINTNTVSSCILTIGVQGGAIGDNFWVTNLQWEQKGYATSFTDKFRDNESIYIPANLSTDGTVEFWYIPTMPPSGMTGQPNSPQLLQIGTYYNNASITLWAWYNGSTPSLRLLVKGQTNSGWSLQYISANTTWYQVGVPVHIAISWSAGSNFKVYINGVLDTATAQTITDPITSFSADSNVWLGSHYNSGNGTYSGTSSQAGIFDDIRISNVQHADTDISSNYSSGKPALVDSSTIAKVSSDFPNTVYLNGNTSL